MNIYVHIYIHRYVYRVDPLFNPRGSKRYENKVRPVWVVVWERLLIAWSA